MDLLNPGDRVSRLVIDWLAGHRYEPVQRWAIWEVIPKETVARIIDDERKAGMSDSMVQGLWKDLQGPDPRTSGKWIKADDVPGGQRWVSKSTVSRNQWDIHQRTGGLPMLCWIVEGPNGGHAWQFGMFEQSFLLAAGVDPQLVQQMVAAWPDPGSLPYAPYDNRVFHALRERDQLAKWRQARAWDDRTRRSNAGIILSTETTDQRREMLERTMLWLDKQISDAVSDIPRKLLPQWSDFATGQNEYGIEQQLNHYLLET